MKAVNYITAIGVAACMAGCGGGGGGGGGSASASPASQASVSNMSASALTYGQPATITVTGQNLDQGISLLAPGCNNITLATGATASQEIFNCTPAISGTMLTIAQSSSGTLLDSISPVVPVPQVTLNTTMGQMVFALYPNNAPKTVANFMQYVTSGFYSNKIFHRVVSGFVIQGGGYDTTLTLAPTMAPIALEWPNGLSNVLGTVAMARTSVLNSATSQFFINVVDNSSTLDTSGGGYAVFGSVVTGMNVANLIAAVPTETLDGMDNVPVTPIVITSATQTQ